eukprot:3799085-Prymnesium_polylepis.4
MNVQHGGGGYVNDLAAWQPVMPGRVETRERVCSCAVRRSGSAARAARDGLMCELHGALIEL